MMAVFRVSGVSWADNTEPADASVEPRVDAGSYSPFANGQSDVVGLKDGTLVDQPLRLDIPNAFARALHCLAGEQVGQNPLQCPDGATRPTSVTNRGGRLHQRAGRYPRG